MKKNIITTTITTEYSATEYNLPIEIAQMVSRMIEPYKAKAETPKAKPKAKTEPKPKAKVKTYTVTEDGKGILVGTNGFIPTKVFKGVTYSLKQSGATYDAKTKAWIFKTKTECKAWCKSQDARG